MLVLFLLMRVGILVFLCALTGMLHVMMNKGVTATVSVDSYAVCCTFVCWCVLIPRFVGMF